LKRIEIPAVGAYESVFNHRVFIAMLIEHSVDFYCCQSSVVKEAQQCKMNTNELSTHMHLTVMNKGVLRLSDKTKAALSAFLV